MSVLSYFSPKIIFRLLNLWLRFRRRFYFVAFAAKVNLQSKAVTQIQNAYREDKTLYLNLY